MLKGPSAVKRDTSGVEPRNDDKYVNTPNPILLPHIQDRTTQFDRDTFLHQHLVILKDEQSSYQSVIRACAYVNQLIAREFESSVTIHERGNIWTQTRMIHMASYVEESSEIISTLSFTISHHHDRRSRIIAIETLVNQAMASLVNCIIVPQFMNDDDISLIMRLQDEICNDVVLNLTSCALEDDDGVAALIFESIGNMTSGIDPYDKESNLFTGYMSSHAVIGNSDDYYLSDDKTYNNMKSRFLSKYQDFDFPFYMSDLKNRMMNFVLIPRARKLLCRMQQLKGLEYKIRSLSLMNRMIIHSYIKWLNQNDSSLNSSMDKLSFAKRWFEYDVDTMVHEYIQGYLSMLLTISESTEGNLVSSCEQSCLVATNEALRLISVLDSEYMSYGLLVSIVFENLESLLERHDHHMDMDTSLEIVKCAVLASRVIPFENSLKLFRQVTKVVITHFPAVMRVPLQASIPSFYLSDDHADLPIRFRVWIEIASSFFLSSSETESSSNLFSNSLSAYLKDESVTSLMSSRAELIESQFSPNIAEEMVYAFCTIALTFSKTMVDSPALYSLAMKHWLNCSLKILKAFAPCLGWPRINSDKTLDEPFSFEGALTLHSGAQKAYLELLSCILCICKLIPSPSLYNYFINSTDIKPDSLNYDNFENPVIDISVENAITQLLDYIQNFSKNSPSRKVRLSILSILCDSWVCKCRQTVDQSGSLSSDGGPVDIDEDISNINEQQARSLLSLLGNEISALIRENASSKGMKGSSIKSQSVSVLRGLLLCIACIESMCYTAHLAANFFATDESFVDEEESARYIVSLCQLVLKGQGKMDIVSDEITHQESDPDLSNSHETIKAKSIPISPQSPNSKARINAFTMECSDAAKRIDTFIGIREDTTEQDGLNPQSIDFSCLCPLMKRPHFGLGGYDSTDVSVSNALWALNNAISSVSGLDHCTPSCKLLLRHEVQEIYQLSESCKQFLSCRNELSRHSLSVNMMRGNVLPRIVRNIDSKDPVVDVMVPCTIISGSSDPLEISLTVSLRTCKNGQNSVYTVVVSIEIHNKTPITIPNGLIVTISATEAHTPSSFHVKDMQVHIDKEINSNDRYTCEFIFFYWPMRIVKITPRITFKCLQIERKTIQRVIVEESDKMSYSLVESTPSLESIRDVDIYCETVSTPNDLSFAVNQHFMWSAGGDIALFTVLWMMSPQINFYDVDPSKSVIGELPSITSDKLQYFTMKNITASNECVLVQKTSSDNDEESFVIKTLRN